MVNFIKKKIEIIILLTVIAIFYSPSLASIASDNIKLPIPADTIVGLYHPYRDSYASIYPNGIPFKNFLITDPVRQTYVWKELAIDNFKNFDLPLWNSYEMAGKPLLGNFQSGAFYPLNLLLFLFPFSISWSLFILSQSFLIGIFMYFFLRNLKLTKTASLIGSISISFCGFSISWLEWGTVLHTALWLPLILLAKDKLLLNWSRKWVAILVFAEASSFLAGHLQTFFYIFIIGNLYLASRIVLQSSVNKKFDARKAVLKILPFLFVGAIILAIVSAQLFSTFQFISLSSRALDQNYNQAGWFLPYQNLIQFVAPDFFGNPATLNYFGEWNYAEFVGYLGIAPFALALFALILRRDKKTYFFSAFLLLSILFATKNFVSILPYQYEIPFISSAQPTRLIFISSFSLAVLSALGFDYLKKSKKIWIIITLLFITFLTLWSWVITNQKEVSLNNLKLPTLLFAISSISVMGLAFLKKKYKIVFLVLLILSISFDLLRFSWKFTPFTSSSYLFPSTKSIEFIKSKKGIFRVSALDRRIFPPNFLTHYKIQSIEGYDPLYLKNYAEFVSALERNEANIKHPFGYNRIITPHNYNSQLFNLLNVEYVFSLDEIDSPKLTKVFEEGSTKIYKNEDAFARTFFVEKLIKTKNVVKKMFEVNLRTTAIINDKKEGIENMSVGRAIITSYSDNRVEIKTVNKGEGFLVLSDADYPTWKVFVDGKEAEIITTNHAFRGVFVQKGEHKVEFKNWLF